MAERPELPFGARVRAALDARGPLCVGVDPHPALLGAWGLTDDPDGLERFALTVVDALADRVAVLKPQSAFFERHGSRGIAVLERVIAAARAAGALVVLDGKRGDIGSTARAYAEAYLEGEPPRADALTVNPYLGRESVEPYLAAARRNNTGIFVLVKTSNAGADVQDVVLKDGQAMWHHVASLVAEWGEDLVGEVGLSSVGAVVGATHPRAVAEARRLMPQSVILLPGVGAQGGAVEDLVRAFQSGPASALVNASRSVNYAYRDTGGDYRDAAGAEAARLKQQIWLASGW